MGLISDTLTHSLLLFLVPLCPLCFLTPSLPGIFLLMINIPFLFNHRCLNHSFASESTFAPLITCNSCPRLLTDPFQCLSKPFQLGICCIPPPSPPLFSRPPLGCVNLPWQLLLLRPPVRVFCCRITLCPLRFVLCSHPITMTGEVTKTKVKICFGAPHIGSQLPKVFSK